MNTRPLDALSRLALVAALAAGCGDATNATPPGADTGARADAGERDDVSPPVDVGAVDGGPPPALAAGVVPRIDAAMKARLRAVFLAGQARGNHRDVFSKVGDSITESGSFLKDIACDRVDLARRPEVRAAIAFFGARRFPQSYTDVYCEVANAFSASSLSASAGWAAGDAFNALDPPRAECAGANNNGLRCEYARMRPSVALIMYGTNDLERFNDPAMYRTALARVVDATLELGIIPVLSTIPPRLDRADYGARVAPHNRAVAELARARNVPLWDYHLALADSRLERQGISADGVHPSIYGDCASECNAVDFSGEGLRYGYNVRNYTALRVLDRVRAVVIEDGPPDP